MPLVAERIAIVGPLECRKLEPLVCTTLTFATNGTYSITKKYDLGSETNDWGKWTIEDGRWIVMHSDIRYRTLGDAVGFGAWVDLYPTNRVQYLPEVVQAIDNLLAATNKRFFKGRTLEALVVKPQALSQSGSQQEASMIDALYPERMVSRENVQKLREEIRLALHGDDLNVFKGVICKYRNATMFHLVRQGASLVEESKRLKANVDGSLKFSSTAMYEFLVQGDNLRCDGGVPAADP